MPVIIAALLLLIFLPQRALSAIPAPPQDLSFEVATIKPSDPEDRSGKFVRMQSTQRFEARNCTVKDLITAAYNLPFRAISGGPAWIDSDHYNILAVTPGEGRPTQDQQMSMLRSLLANRLNLSVHREEKEQPLYELTLARGGPKLKESNPSTQEYLINTMFNDNHVLLPAKKVTMAQFAAMLQRAVVERAVVDKTGLTAKYDFDLENPKMEVPLVSKELEWSRETETQLASLQQVAPSPAAPPASPRERFEVASIRSRPAPPDGRRGHPGYKRLLGPQGPGRG